MTFRLLVINPNSDERVTSDLRARVLSVLPPGVSVEAVDCPRSPPVIETAVDDILAGPDVLRAALGAVGVDAYLVGCFGDPAVLALREALEGPVVGLGEAALMQASIVTSRFGLITTLERGIPALWAQLAASGVAASCAGVMAMSPAHGTPVTAAGEAAGVAEDGQDELDRLVDCGRRLLADGADGLVLACAAFGRYAPELTRVLEVPVCDGIGFAATALYGLWASGVSTSKRGSYAPPLSDLAFSLANAATAPARAPSSPA